MTKPREKTREELQAEIEDGKKKIRQFENPYANHIGVRLDKEQAPEYSSVYGIDLPDGQSAGDYSLGDRVEVMYTGEPATILTIWAEQLVDIKLLK